MPTTSSIHPVIAELAQGLEKLSEAEQVPNEFHGVDWIVADGSIRLASEGDDPSESISLYRFTRTLVLEWSCRFDASTPRRILVDAIAGALEEAIGL